MYFHTVYYSAFWYSRFLSIPPESLGGQFRIEEQRRHLHALRLLAIFFEQIYIPRTHLLTQVTPLQCEICAAVLNSNEAAFLREAEILRVSVSPGLDGDNDNLRILERESQTACVTYPSSKAYLRNLRACPPIVVESARESMGNTISFPDYARLLETASPSLSKIVLEATRRASLKDIPFFHEAFIVSLRNTLNESAFDKAWRDTNSIYLTSGVPNATGVVAYFDPEIEAPRQRFYPHAIDRALFHPHSLQSFLEVVMTPSCVRALLDKPVDRIMAYLLENAERRNRLALFRSAFFDIVASISKVTAVIGGAPERFPRLPADQFRLALSNRTDGDLDLLRDSTRVFDATIDQTSGKVLTAVKLALLVFGPTLWRWGVRMRHPQVVALTSDLKEIARANP